MSQYSKIRRPHKKSSFLASLENLEDVLTLNVLVKLAETGNNFSMKRGMGSPVCHSLLNV